MQASCLTPWFVYVYSGLPVLIRARLYADCLVRALSRPQQVVLQQVTSPPPQIPLYFLNPGKAKLLFFIHFWLNSISFECVAKLFKKHKKRLKRFFESDSIFFRHPKHPNLASILYKISQSRLQLKLNFFLKYCETATF
jgi:hypothetical protein